MAYDLFFLTYSELNAETNWAEFKARYPHAKRVHGIPGIVSAHKRCSELSLTSHFFVVDGDNKMDDGFDFTMRVDPSLASFVHLWYARNRVNPLEYGWGGLKLFPKSVFKDMEVGIDMTTSFPLHIIPTVVSTTEFDNSPYDAWRSGFREAVKLFKKNDEESLRRLDVWEQQSLGGLYPDYVTKGVREGIAYAARNKFLHRINDWDWLAMEFKFST